MDRQFDAVLFVWNKALAIKVHCYKARGQSLSHKNTSSLYWQKPDKAENTHC
ncbi:helix-turn-helix domain-containing protein [Endozoicomonas sp. ONNA2]|uniref:helix-turn-helix domain-containing protein n=1 Tax=Endozoicomonas sp. ONNA2 TaxID=2828741 RepID=UPI00359FE12A